MKELSCEEVKQMVEPIQGDLVLCVQSGWDDYFQEYSNLLHRHSRAARTRLIYDSTISFARNSFSGKEGIKIIDDFNETFFLLLENKVSIRFKKHGQNGKTSNAKTKRNTAYVKQTEMNEIPNTVHLYCGYQPDNAFRKIDSILLTCPGPLGNRWMLHLTNDDYMKSIIPMTSIIDTPKEILLPKLRIKGEDLNAAQNQS